MASCSKHASTRAVGAWGRSTLVLTLVVSGLVGCVERRLTVRSEPTNALVILDGQEIGHSPVSVPFTYYGDREINLIKDGYETLTVRQRVTTPWYQYIGLDFVSEVLWPWRIRDQRNYVYQMRPSVMVSTTELLQRANQVRVEGENPPPRALERAGLSTNPLDPTSDSQLVPASATQAEPQRRRRPFAGLFRRSTSSTNATGQSFNPITDQ